MKLFNQLSDEEQTKVISYCMQLIASGWLEEGLDPEAHSEEDCEIKCHIEEILLEASKIEDEDDKIKCLLDDEIVFEEINNIALSMAQGAYYHDPDEMVIFPELLELCDHDGETSEKEEIKIDPNLN